MKQSDSTGDDILDRPITAAEQHAAMSETFGKEYAERFSDPVVFLRRRLNSPAAIQFYKREFPLVSRTLHLESVYRRRREFSQDVLDAFAALSAKKLEDILRMLQLNAERLQKLCKTNASGETAVYLHPEYKVVPIIAAGSRSYMTGLDRLDEVYTLTGQATLNGLIDGNQRKSAELLCRKAVRAYSAMVRTESIKLRKEVQRLSAANSAAPDPEMTHAEQALDSAVQEFDQVVADEAVHDPANHVPGESAADLISDMTATTAATAATAKKPRASKKATTAEPESAPAGAAGA